MSDTPRTDETQFKPSEEHPAFNLAQYMVKAEFAQTLERENAALRGWSKAQLDELHRVSEALGTNDGHSSVTHIEILKEENTALRIALTEIECHHNETDDWREIARAALTRKENGK